MVFVFFSNFQDWVKCRLNINYIDSPNIKIKCRALHPYVDIPLETIINCNDFHFERIEEVDGMKMNVYAITWTPQITEHNEFCIAIDDRVQFDNYGTYLKNMIKVCRIAEDGKFLIFCVSTVEVLFFRSRPFFFFI